MRTAALPQAAHGDQSGATRSWACIYTGYPQCTWRAQPASQSDSIFKKRIKKSTPSICFSSSSSISSSSPRSCHLDSLFHALPHQFIQLSTTTTTSGAVAWINRPQQLGLSPEQDHPSRLDQQHTLFFPTMTTSTSMSLNPHDRTWEKVPCYCLCLCYDLFGCGRIFYFYFFHFYLLKFTLGVDKWASNCVVWAHKGFVYTFKMKKEKKRSRFWLTTTAQKSIFHVTAQVLQDHTQIYPKRTWFQ